MLEEAQGDTRGARKETKLLLLLNHRLSSLLNYPALLSDDCTPGLNALNLHSGLAAY